MNRGVDRPPRCRQLFLGHPPKPDDHVRARRAPSNTPHKVADPRGRACAHQGQADQVRLSEPRIGSIGHQLASGKNLSLSGMARQTQERLVTECEG